MTFENKPKQQVKEPADETIPSRSRIVTNAKTLPVRPRTDADKPEKAVVAQSAAIAKPENGSADIATSNPPWTLQQFFNGEIDLDVELSKRFANMPLMSTIHFRSLGTRTGRGVATLTTVDGASSVIFDADVSSREVQISFTFGSMLTLRFSLNRLSDVDRTRWLDLMRRQQGGLAFLWGPSRWQNDYVICLARKYFTNFYAFSPRNFEAAIRMTPDVSKKLLNWLEDIWKQYPPDEEPPKLLTW